MYKRFSVLFTVLLVITLFVPTLPAEDVRVGLTYVSSGFSNNLSNKTILYLRGSPSTTEYEIVDLYTGYVIFTGAGVQNVEARSGYIYVTGKGPYANPVIIRAKNPGTEFVSVGYNNWQFKVYRGRFEARVSNGYVKLVNIVDLDEYIYGVVPVEIGGTSPVEALKAQAVVARTLAIIRRNLNIHQADGFDVCDLTHCQVYGSQYSNKGGYSVETTKCCAAVDDTAGILLYYNGSLVKDMTYHGHCGGKVANIEDIWGGSASPYLKGLDDSSNGTVFCAWDFTYNAWEKSITQSELQSKLKGNANTAPANSASTLAADGISISEYDSSGRAKYITIKYETPAESKVVRGNTFRGVVGYTYLPSHLITALTYSSASGVYIFKGKGSGHGAGMCQDGAIGMGDHGYTYNQILQHYFTTSISIVDKGGPNILHVPVTQTVAKKQFIVSVTATDRSGVQSVDVYYRTAGRLVYTQKKGVSVAVNVYEVIVDSGVVTTAGVEYYIKVVDTAGNLAYSGSDTVPYKVNVNDSDTDPPSIVHSVNQYAFEQTTITVTASVNDDYGIQKVTLYYRNAGTIAYSGWEMQKAGTNGYTGYIPRNIVTVGGIEYYIEAVDNNNNRGYVPIGYSTAPYMITIRRTVSMLRGQVRQKGSGVALSGALCVLSPGNVKYNTDVNGNYVFDNLNQGTYFLSVSKTGFVNSDVLRINLPVGETITQNFTLSETDTSSVSSTVVVVNSVFSPNHSDTRKSKAVFKININNATTQNVVLKIYGSTGRLVRVIDNSDIGMVALVSNELQMYWDGYNENSSQVSSGVYFFQVELEGSVKSSGKVVVAK